MPPDVWIAVGFLGGLPLIVLIVCLLTGDWDVFDRKQRAAQRDLDQKGRT